MDKLTFLCLIIFLTLLSYGIARGEKIQVFYRGSDLIYHTETGDDLTLREIDGYIKGVADAYSGVMWCSDKNLTYEEINKIVSDYIYSHPKEWNTPARDIFLNALMQVLPCKPKRTTDLQVHLSES